MLVNLFKKSSSAIVLDQGIVSGSNFALGIFLVSIMGIENYGSYSLIWLIILFFQSLQMSIIISPLMNIAGTLGLEEKYIFYQTSFGLQILLSIIFGLLSDVSLIVIGKFDNSYLMNIELLVVVFFVVLSTQLFEFGRRSCFVLQNPWTAVQMNVVKNIVLYTALIAMLFATE